MDSNNYIDVDYQENQESDKIKDRATKGEPLFWTTLQVSEVLGEETSTIRYWSKRFERLLDIEVSNRNKQYKKSDIAKLKFIQKLARQDGLTLQQIEDYCDTKGFNITEIEKAVIDANNPLAIQAFVSAITVEFDKKLSTFQEAMTWQINDYFKQTVALQQNMNDKLHENLVTTVDEVVSEKLDTKLNEMKEYLDTKELEAKTRDIEMIDALKNSMEKRKEENSQNEKRGLWNRIFGK